MPGSTSQSLLEALSHKSLTLSLRMDLYTSPRLLLDADVSTGTCWKVGFEGLGREDDERYLDERVDAFSSQTAWLGEVEDLGIMQPFPHVLSPPLTSAQRHHKLPVFQNPLFHKVANVLVPLVSFGAFCLACEAV